MVTKIHANSKTSFLLDTDMLTNWGLYQADAEKWASWLLPVDATPEQVHRQWVALNNQLTRKHRKLIEPMWGCKLCIKKKLVPNEGWYFWIATKQDVQYVTNV
jgi:hypothetical protein